MIETETPKITTREQARVFVISDTISMIRDYLNGGLWQSEDQEDALKRGAAKWLIRELERQAERIAAQQSDNGMMPEPPKS